MAYFEKINDIEECNALYRILSKKMHPDLGGSETDFKDMKEEYEFRVKELSTVPEFLKDENILLAKSLLGIAKSKSPEQTQKVQTAATALSMLLGLTTNKKAQQIKTFIDRVNE